MTPANTAGSRDLVAYKLERISCAAAIASSEPAAAPPSAGARPSSSIRSRTSANQHESRDGCGHDGVNADRLHADHVASRHDEPSESRVGESEACCSSDGEKYQCLDELLTN